MTNKLSDEQKFMIEVRYHLWLERVRLGHNYPVEFVVPKIIKDFERIYV